MTKAILSSLLTIVMMAICPLNTWADETKPEKVGGVYQLKSADDLYWFAAYVNAGNTKTKAALTCDITVNEGVLTDHVYNTPAEGSEFKEWTPIGTPSNPYHGTFDGQGHTVSGLVNTSKSELTGFFGHIGNATIKNLGVKDTYFLCLDMSGGISGFCAYDDEEFTFAIENCWFDGLIEGTYDSYDLGGILGGTYSDEAVNMSTIVNCYNLGVIKGDASSDYVGGIIGYDEDNNVDVKNCYNVGKVSGAYFVGSIAGEKCNTIENCYYLAASATAKGVTHNGVGVGEKATPATDKEGETTSTTQAQFANGEICYLLNGDQKKIVFGQTVGEGYPSLTSKAVVYAVQPTCKDKATYTNDLSKVVVTKHSLTKVAKADMVPGVSHGMACDHYRCSDCGKIFSDAEAKNEIDDPTIHDDIYGECTICHRRTKDYVVKIGTVEELLAFAKAINEGSAEVTNAILTADIVLNENVLTDHVYNTPAEGNEFKKWTPIGTASSPYHGTFDGQGHTVSGLVNTSKTYLIGFFGHIGNATIKNLGVKDTYFHCNSISGGIAGFCAYNDERFTFAIENCWFDGLIEGIDDSCDLGGITGGTYSNEAVNMSTIVNCYNLGVIKAGDSTDRIGGIIGLDEDNNVVVKNCYNVGNVSGYRNVGSIAGDGCNAIENCYYLEASATAEGVTQNGVGVGENETPAEDNEGKTTSATQAQFASGEICYLLNGDQKKIVFGQTIGEGYPSLTSKAVVYASLPTCQSEATYTNDQSKVVVTKHSLSAKVEKSDMVPGVSHGMACDHYSCSDCGKIFSDAEGKNEIDDPTIHDYVDEECTICHRRTKDYVVKIGTVEELLAFAKAINEGEAEASNAILTADIVLNENVLTDRNYNTPAEGSEFTEWTPIGTKHNPYHGTFDGNGHTVSGLVNTGEDDLTGFFGHIGNATIRNLGVKDTYFRCYGFSGGIAGFCARSDEYFTFAIENCWFDGLIESVDNCFHMGGIIGGTWSNEEEKMSTIVNCYNLGVIKGGDSTGSIGGIIGYDEGNNVVVKNCYNAGNVSGTMKVGSIAGDECYSIDDCYYLEGKAMADGLAQNGIGVDENVEPAADKEGETTSATDEQMESGEICYLLNGDQSKIVFYQEIGVDASPVFTSKYMVKKDDDNTYYNEKAPLPTAVEKVNATAPSSKAYKTIENGRIVIVKDGQKWDLMGRKL